MSEGPLTSAAVQEALYQAFLVRWHPLWVHREDLDDLSPFYLKSIETDPFTEISIVTTFKDVKVAINSEGYSSESKLPVFSAHISPPETEPKDNDGREECFWCKCKTKKVAGFSTAIYDICPGCKK